MVDFSEMPSALVRGEEGGYRQGTCLYGFLRAQEAKRVWAYQVWGINGENRTHKLCYPMPYMHLCNLPWTTCVANNHGPEPQNHTRTPTQRGV